MARQGRSPAVTCPADGGSLPALAHAGSLSACLASLSYRPIASSSASLSAWRLSGRQSRQTACQTPRQPDSHWHGEPRETALPAPYQPGTPGGIVRDYQPGRILRPILSKDSPSSSWPIPCLRGGDNVRLAQPPPRHRTTAQPRGLLPPSTPASSGGGSSPGPTCSAGPRSRSSTGPHTTTGSPG